MQRKKGAREKMGTGGAFGFRVDGADKVTYNHFDSYPSGLGRMVIDSLFGRDIESLKSAARDIVLVDKGVKPTSAQMDELRKYANREVGSRQLDDWYVLLREAQGDLSLWISREIPVMIDSQKFLSDSLFCEFAYIVNLDESKVEFYRGFNHSASAPGRYAALKLAREQEDGDAYYGVALVDCVDLKSITDMDVAGRDALISKWDGEESEAEDPATVNAI